MKRAIDHRVYDTDTAKALCSYTHHYGKEPHREDKTLPGNVQYTETLYQRRDGLYFLHGHGFGDYTGTERYGGGGGCHGRSYGVSYRPVAGDKIIPMTEEEVGIWLKKHRKKLPL